MCKKHLAEAARTPSTAGTRTPKDSSLAPSLRRTSSPGGKRGQERGHHPLGRLRACQQHPGTGSIHSLSERCGYFILIATSDILNDGEVRANILAFHSTQTKRVCRSTLAQRRAIWQRQWKLEIGSLSCWRNEEALTGNMNLRSWPEVVERRQRVYVTDAKSVYDYLQKDATSSSSGKRMAIEGALLRETVRRPGAHVKWIDGMQNIANVVTKCDQGRGREGHVERLPPECDDIARPNRSQRPAQRKEEK